VDVETERREPAPGHRPETSPLGRWWSLLRARRSPRLERALTALAFAIFVVAAVMAYRHLPSLEARIRWPFLALAAVVGVPALIVVNGAEYRVAGLVLGRRVPLLESLRVSLLGSAANILPVPGAVLVRTRALRQLGIPYREGGSVTVAVGAGWIGTAGVLSGPLLLWAGRRAVGSLLLLGGSAALAASAWLIARHSAGRTAPLFLRVLAVEIAAVAVGTFRYYFVLLGLGIDASLPQAAAFTVAASASSATGLFPGGLGIRELLAGAVSDLVGLTIAVGVFAAAVNRLLEFVVMSPLTLGLALRRRTGSDVEGSW
jgi:uncharacterized membrane protein YbhN (UPF0104 family)